MDNLSCILFDLDGTLYLQRPLRQRMLRLLLMNCLFHPFSGYRTIKIIKAYRHAQEAMRETSDSTLSLSDRQLQWAAERTNVAVDEVRKTVGYWMEERPLPFLKEIIPAGLKECLAAMKTRNLKLGIVSDYPAPEKLKAMQLDQFFDVMVSAQDENVQSFKPNPKGLITAVGQLNCSVEQCLYIGDRPEIDGEVARRAKIRFLLFDPREKYSSFPDRFTSYQTLASTLFAG